MSYLNVPRIHFAGTFLADPSTVNNNDANFDPTAQLAEETPNPNDPANTSVYWNPNGTHNFQFQNCTVRGAVGDDGQFSTPANDPIVGAGVLSVGSYPAKIVDLDPDNQAISQIFGLNIQINIPDPHNPGTTLASVTALMPPSAFSDLWNRATNAPSVGNATMCAAYQATLTNVVWVNPQASPILTALQKLSPNALSIRFNVDSMQSNADQVNFRLGRVVGTFGPSMPNEAPRSAPRRLTPPAPAQGPPFFTSFGPVNALWDASRSVLVLDLGNCAPTDGTPPKAGDPTVPVDGWPVPPVQFELMLGGNPPSFVGFKSGAPPHLPSPIPISFDHDTYVNQTGIVEVKIPPAEAAGMLTIPLTLHATLAGQPVVAAQEDPQGRYVDVDLPFLRLNPGESGDVTLWATKFGVPYPGLSLDLAQVAGQPNGTQWPVGTPTNALTITSAPTGSVTTDANGKAIVTLTAGDPGTPRTYATGYPGPDGQVYLVGGSWMNWGGIFLFPGAPINVLIFSGYTAPAQPTWKDVGPIFTMYSRLFPYMKGILDLSDYATVSDPDNADSIRYVLNLPISDPHHMPVVRDLSRDKLAMINTWFANGTPQG